MADTLEAVKDRISEHYLGKSGIHAVGVRRSANAITVYFKPSSDPAQQCTLEVLKREASPYKVITKEAAEANFAPF
jgi:hypothetical protein